MFVDLVIKNGKIVTSQATYEGDDIAVKNGKIIAIDKQGSYPDLLTYMYILETPDLPTKKILPQVQQPLQWGASPQYVICLIVFPLPVP